MRGYHAGRASETANFFCGHRDYRDNQQNQRLTDYVWKRLLGSVPGLHQVLHDVAGTFHIRSAFGVAMCAKVLFGRFPHLRSFSKSTAHRRPQETIGVQHGRAWLEDIGSTGVMKIWGKVRPQWTVCRSHRVCRHECWDPFGGPVPDALMSPRDVRVACNFWS